MKKNYAYGIVFVWVAFLSTINFYNAIDYNYINKPLTTSYKFGIPDIAKGVNSESVVKIYDRDEWYEHIGNESEADDLFGEGTDADRIGAKSMTEVLDWEKDQKIPFFADLILTAELEMEGSPEVETFLDVFDFIRTPINDFADRLGFLNGQGQWLVGLGDEEMVEFCKILSPSVVG